MKLFSQNQKCVLLVCKTSIAKSSEAIVTKPFDQRQFYSWKSARLFIMRQVSNPGAAWLKDKRGFNFKVNFDKL